MNKKTGAKYEALCEAADHLEQCWTEDPLEREAGDELSARLRKEAESLKEPKNGKGRIGKL